MIGHDVVEEDTSYGLLDGNNLKSKSKARTAASLALVGLCGLALFTARSLLPSGEAATAPLATPTLSKASDAQWRGVSLGGWLLMEINPSKRDATSPMDLRPGWMFDQIEEHSELDFVTALRKEKGDEFTIQTMRNHWEHYYTGEMLDAAKKLGVDTVRIPVGYWIMDAPVGGKSPYEYGFTPEGFVSGGLNSLLKMLKLLKERDMGALVDIHAMPCNSACVSDGLYCQMPMGFLGKGQAPIADLERCEAAGGGVYKTLRKPTPEMEEWPDVGINAISQMAKFISELPKEADSVICFQLANEPALGPTSREIYQGIVAFYDRGYKEARKFLPKLPLIFSFMGPTPEARAWLSAANAKDLAAGGSGLTGDHHYYINWQACCGLGYGVPAINAMPWDEIHRRACLLEAEGNAHDINVYANASLQVIVGEWSLATNMDAPMDLKDAEVRKNLIHFYQEQIQSFSGRSEVRGYFFWTLRMGSGWDPRPTDTHPHGHQLAGSSAWKSLDDYPFKVWSLLEMGREGIASSLDAKYDVCKENRCQGPLGSCPGLGDAPAPVVA